MIAPSSDEFYLQMMSAINDGLECLQSFERWSRHDDMTKYINVLEEWDDKVAPDTELADSKYLNPQDLIDPADSTSYRNMVKELFDQTLYDTGMYIEQNYERYLRIFW